MQDGGFLEIRISRLVNMIATKFQRLPHVFGGKESNGTIGNTVQRNRKSEIQDGGLQSGNIRISLLVDMIGTINILTGIGLPILSPIIATKWPMPPKICKLCTGKARKPY